jgi:hypothetical protein
LVFEKIASKGYKIVTKLLPYLPLSGTISININRKEFTYD